MTSSTIQNISSCPDYINKFIPNSIPLEYENIKSPLLGNNVNYHYYVIDIKFSTLQLDKDAEFLLNSNELPAYKSQVCIYNIALGRMQGLTPNYGFILGRRIKFNMSKKKEINMDELNAGGYKFRDGMVFNNNCFSKLGKIDFVDKDKYIMDKTSDAIQWLRKIKKFGPKWTNIMNLDLFDLMKND